LTQQLDLKGIELFQFKKLTCQVNYNRCVYLRHLSGTQQTPNPYLLDHKNIAFSEKGD